LDRTFAGLILRRPKSRQKIARGSPKPTKNRERKRIFFPIGSVRVGRKRPVMRKKTRWAELLHINSKKLGERQLRGSEGAKKRRTTRAEGTDQKDGRETGKGPRIVLL